MESLKSLKEQELELQNSIAARASAVELEERTFTDDEIKADDKDHESLNVVRSKIQSKERIERSRNLATRSEVSVPATSFAVPAAPAGEMEGDIAIRSWLLHKQGHGEMITDRMRNICNRVGIDPTGNEFNVVRSQTIGTANTGGNLVSGAYIKGFEKAQKAYGSVFNEALKIPGGRGEPFFYGYNDNTSNRATYAAELDTANGTTRNVTQISFPKVPKLKSGVEDISAELLLDSDWDVMGWLTDTVFDSLARGANYQATVGDGDTGHMKGLVPSCGAVEAADDAVLSWADVRKLIHSVDYAYRQSGECIFMGHDSILGEIEGLNDENGRSLLAVDYTAPTPYRIKGFRFVVNNDMASTVEAEAKVLVFGNLKKFAWRDCGAPKLVMDYNNKTDSHSVFGYYRAYTRDLNAAALKVLQMKAS